MPFVSFRNSSLLPACLLVARVVAQDTEWVLPIDGPTIQYATGVACDSADNVYVCGTAYGHVDFHPGPGDPIGVTAGLYDMFLAKYDASGAYLWSHLIGGTDTERLLHVAADAAGNTYAGGEGFGQAFDMDPGPGVLMSADAVEKGLLVKFDPDGALAWAGSLPGNNAQIVELRVTPMGGVICRGSFRDSIDVDIGPDTLLLHAPANPPNQFLAAYDANGSLLWAETLGNYYLPSYAGYELLAVADNGDLVLALCFGGPTDMDPGADELIFTCQENSNDIALLRLDSDGALLWAKQIAGPEYDACTAITLDDEGNIMMVGMLRDSLDLGGMLLHATGDSITNSFVARFDGAGNAIGGFSHQGTRAVIGSTAVMSGGALLMAGHLHGTCDMDPGPGTSELTAPLTTPYGFMASYAGNTLLATDYIGSGPSSNQINGSAVDGTGAILLCGLTSGVSDLAPGPDVYMNQGTASNNGFVVKLRGDPSLGTDDPERGPLRIVLAPNPANDAATVQAPERWQRMDLLDVQGRLCRSWSAGTAPYRMDLGGLKEGPYLVRTTSFDGALLTAPLVIATH